MSEKKPEHPANTNQRNGIRDAADEEVQVMSSLLLFLPAFKRPPRSFPELDSAGWLDPSRCDDLRN